VTALSSRSRRHRWRWSSCSASAAGVRAVYTPKDFRLATIVGDLVDLAIEHRTATRSAAPTR